MKPCATDCREEVVVKQSGNLLPITTETTDTISFCNVKSTFDPQPCMLMHASMSTDAGTIKLEKVHKESKVIKNIELFLSKKQ